MVTLAELKMSDCEDLARLVNDKRVVDQLRNQIPHPYGVEDAMTFVKACSNIKPTQNFAVRYQDEFVGCIGCHPFDDVYFKSAEIGYWIGQPYWGQGIATEAVKKLIEYARDTFDLIRIQASVFSSNPASMKVLEKAGFKKEAVLEKKVYKNDQLLDEHVYCYFPER